MWVGYEAGAVEGDGRASPEGERARGCVCACVF